jgi:hypothetical protein
MLPVMSSPALTSPVRIKRHSSSTNHRFPPGGAAADESTLLTKTAIGPSVIGLVIGKKADLS